MDRRKAIRILLLGSASITSVTGIKYLYHQYSKPDISFLSSKMDLLAELAETIIPTTDTPGAKSAGVNKYILKMIKDCTEPSSQTNFINGIKEIEEYCLDNYRKSFINCSTSQKQESLAFFEKSGSLFNGIAGKIEKKLLGKSFFSILKEYTVIGYCTSRPGATEALNYDYIPGQYLSSYPVKTNQKSWATR